MQPMQQTPPARSLESGASDRSESRSWLIFAGLPKRLTEGLNAAGQFVPPILLSVNTQQIG